MEQLFNQLWLYNNWANEALFNLFDAYGAMVPEKCMHLLSHMMNTQFAWISRINGEHRAINAWEDHDLEQCRVLHQETTLQLKQAIENLDQASPEKISYVNSKGIAFENFTNDILLHVLNHGTYHRGQIAQELRRNGLEPVNTDYITFMR